MTKLGDIKRWVIYGAIGVGLSTAHALGTGRVTTSSYGDGNYTVGLAASLVNSNQKQINDLIKHANTREGGISASEMGSAYEFSASLESRMSGSTWGVQFRPAWFTQKSRGSSNHGAFNYELTGPSLFVAFRNYLLENETIHLFVQFGIGAGLLNGMIEENNVGTGRGKVDFTGQSFGSMVGLGTDLCSESHHCLTIEGFYRYLKFDRNIAKSSAGTFDSYGGSLSQYGRKQEVEIANQDLVVQMGGLIFQVGYAFRF